MNATVMNATVKDVMTSPVLTVSEDATLDQVASFFLENNITGGPVTSASGAVVGVVSMTDIVRHDSAPTRSRSPHDTHEYYLSTMGDRVAEEEMAGFRIDEGENVSVSDLMTPMVFEVDEDTPVQQVADLMIRGNIHRVFVTRDKKLVGIVAAMDLLKVVRDL